MVYVSVAIALLGFAYASREEDRRTNCAVNERHQNLPAEIRVYDQNRDGYLDSSELKRLVDDVELRKR